MMAAQCTSLPNGSLHMHHGPIDLVISLDGPAAAQKRACARAWTRFETILEELVEELPALRSPHRSVWKGLKGRVARRMAEAVDFSDMFITPMAAVAGAVADEMLSVLAVERDLSRVIVNNGGDIAVHLTAGTSCCIGIVANPITGKTAGSLVIDAADKARGAATSGWRGRSFSLGIADAVTIIAKNGASADAAASLIANAVDLPRCAKIIRKPARALKEDSDLGELLVTCDVPPLSFAEIERALDSGARAASSYVKNNIIHAAALCLQGETRLVDHAPALRSGPAKELAHAST